MPVFSFLDRLIEIGCTGFQKGKGGLLGRLGLAQLPFQPRGLAIRPAALDFDTRALKQNCGRREQAPANHQRGEPGHHRLTPR